MSNDCVGLVRVMGFDSSAEVTMMRVTDEGMSIVGMLSSMEEQGNASNPQVE